MAIAIDASTPARASATGALTTATGSFTAPSGAVLVACVSANSSPAGNPTLAVTDSGGLTWTQRVIRTQSEGGGSTGGVTAIFIAATASSASRTVTATASGAGTANGISVKVYAVTGADTATPTGATAEGASQTNNTTTTAYTSTVNNSRGFACGTDWNELGVPTSTDTGDGADVSGQIAVLSCYKSADTATAGSSVTFNLDAAGAGTPDWTWVALEILPGAGGSPETNYAAPFRGRAPGLLSPTGTLRAQPPGPAKPAPAALLGAAEETDTAVSVGRTHARVLGVASESDTAEPVGRAKASLLGVASETDTSVSVGRAKAFLLGPAAETDTSVSVGRAKASLLGVASETDEAQTVTVVGPAMAYAGPWTDMAPGWQSPTGALMSIFGDTEPSTIAVALGVASETNEAQPVGRAKALMLGPAAETDTSVSVGRAKAFLLGPAAETDSAEPVTAAVPAQPYAGPWTDMAPGWQSPTGALMSIFGDTEPSTITAEVGVASETDTAQPVGRAKALGAASETDEALPVTVSTVPQPYAGPWISITPGWQSPTGQFTPQPFGSSAITNPTSAALGAASETDEAQPVGRVKAKTAGVAATADAAIAIARRKAGTIGASSTTDTARPVGTTGNVPVSSATETDVALGLSLLKVRTVATAAETSTAMTLGRMKARTLGSATETDTAVQVGDGDTSSPTSPITTVSRAAPITTVSRAAPIVTTSRARPVTTGGAG